MVKLDSWLAGSTWASTWSLCCTLLICPSSVFGQIFISPSTPAWKVCFNPSIVELFGSVLPYIKNPILKVFGRQDGSNLINELAGIVGNWVLASFLNRSCKLFLFAIMSAFELLWASSLANSAACLICFLAVELVPLWHSVSAFVTRVSSRAWWLPHARVREPQRSFAQLIETLGV